MHLTWYDMAHMQAVQLAGYRLSFERSIPTSIDIIKVIWCVAR